MKEKTNEQVKGGTPESTVENQKELAGFDSEQALVKAYKSLQSEFTKRSQKLKSAQEELEKLKTLNQVEEVEQSDGDTNEDITVDKTANGSEDKITDFESFLSQFPEADAESVVTGVIEMGVFKKGAFTRQYVRALKERISTLERENSDEDLLIKKATENGKVTESIIKEYLVAIKNSMPKTKVSITGSAPVMPPAKPKSIEEAGALASAMIMPNGK